MTVAVRLRDRAEGNRRDDSLILRIRAGDETAYEELWYRYHKIFLEWVHRWLRFPEWEEECADHAVAVLFEELGKYEPGRSAFCSWAHMVGRSAIIKHIHDLSIQSEDVPLDEMITDMLPALTGPVDDFMNWMVHEEVEQLEPQQRAAVGGCYFEDKTDEEIAKEQHIPRRRVNYRKHQGLVRLRKRFSGGLYTSIRPGTRFFGNSYMMPEVEKHEPALLGGEEGD